MGPSKGRPYVMSDQMILALFDPLFHQIFCWCPLSMTSDLADPLLPQCLVLAVARPKISGAWAHLKPSQNQFLDLL